MNEKERMEALLNHQKPDRIPIWPFAAGGFSVVHSQLPIIEAYTNPEACLAAQRKAAQKFGWVSVPYMAYAGFGGWEFGGDIKFPSKEFDQAPTVTRCPVNTVDDIMNLALPEVSTGGFVPTMMTFYKSAIKTKSDNEPFKAMAPGCGPFTLACNIADTENIVRWMIKDPDAVHRLMRIATDYGIALAVYGKDILGIDGVVPETGEATSANTMISPKHFKEFVLPYAKELQEKVLSLGYTTTYVHICGDHNRNLPFWSQVPFGNPGIISIGHEIELEKAAEYFPGHIILGNMDPTIIQIGTPEEVYNASREVIEQGKRLKNGFIFSPGCEIPPMASAENVMAMTNAVNDFGWYDD